MSSFPAGKYARYKRATAFFLDWLLCARGRGRHADQRVQLEALNDVVKEIAADPSTLTPKLVQELPKALAACHYGITLREHSWHRTLRGVELETPPDLTAVEREKAKVDNYYEVLQVDEDIFPNAGAFVAEKGAPKTATVERLVEEAIADELRMELMYLFMELDELLEGVYKVYSEGKREERSLVEATVVVKLALDTASALTAILQLRYKSLRSAKYMFNIVRNSSLKTFTKKIVDLRINIMKELDRPQQTQLHISPHPIVIARSFHLMQKFYRVNHAAIWADELDPARGLCEMTLEFTTFVVAAAQICASVDRKPQAREVLDVLEKRLVKTPRIHRESSEFRELVQTHSKARAVMGLGQISSPARFSRLEWYLNDVAETYELRLVLDSVNGYRFVGRKPRSCTRKTKSVCMKDRVTYNRIFCKDENCCFGEGCFQQ
ncbi:hypothetical protein PHYPSEUDO_012755 [Phytophthora pseudosyringae]|uniref:DUF6604 domain-containing protein n=1 Tax=Phytophthora pseudosyringae TaxID=221518 RepID=A0A8T1V6A8_9STRA|nr:hypothetical protein PHYPSEUDO_012755 [Phytophthora pseudosyringae]